MPTDLSASTRRRFLASTGVAALTVSLSPRSLLAEDESPVIVIRQAAATAKIAVQNSAAT